MVARIALVKIALALLLIAALFAIYWSGLYGGFFFDDEANILLEEAVRLDTISLESLHQVWSSGHSGPSGRPIAQLSFALNYYFSGFDPFAFKLTNLLIHCVNGILVFFLAYRLGRSTQHQDQFPSLFAAIVTFAWLTHPLQLTSVLYVVQRMTSLSALFLLAALLLHIVSRERGGTKGQAGLLIAWFVLWPMSFFSKETGVLFPLFALAWELLLRRNACQRLDSFARCLTVVLGLSGIAATLYLFLPIGNWLWAGYEMRNFSALERVLTEGRVLCFYISLIFFPRLNSLALHHDDFAISTGLLSPWTTLPALIFLAALIGLIWRYRNTRPLVSFGLAWFLIGHALESTLLPLEIAHEHRNYLPLLGILIATADVFANSFAKSGIRKTLSIVLCAAMLLYFPFVTAMRAHQFADNLRLTQIEAEYHPDSSRSQYEAGRALANLPESASPNSPIFTFARRHFEQATALDPQSKFGLLGLIGLTCKSGGKPEEIWVNGLSQRLRETPLSPGDRTLMFSIKEMSIAGTLCLQRKDVDGLFNAALSNPKVSPGSQSVLLSWFADYLWVHEHDLAAAQGALKQSLELNPGNPSNRLKWAQLVLLSGEPEKARQLLLELQDAQLSAEERKTRTELLTGFNITGR